MIPAAEPTATRRLVYGLLITLAVGSAIGRIGSAQFVVEPNLYRPPGASGNDPRKVWPTNRPEPMPTFSSNDRSRWAAVRALVDEGTYVIGHRDLYYKQRMSSWLWPRPIRSNCSR